MKKYCREDGFTILELTIVTIIFSLFLIGIYTILDTGLKAWNMGQTRTDLQSNGETVVRRMVRDITMSSKDSVTIDPNGKYIAMETPFLNGEFKYNQSETGNPYWQGYIIYYLYDDGKGNKTLYRNYMAHSERECPIPISNISSCIIPPASPTADNKPLATSVETFNVEKIKSVINIRISYRKEPIKKSKGGNIDRFSVAGTADNKGTEIFELQASVEPKN